MEKFKEKLLFPITAIVIANLLISIVGELIKGDWKSYYNLIPTWGWVLIITIVLIVFIIFLFPTKAKKSKKPFSSGFVNLRTPLFGYQDHGKLHYKNVDWHTRVPKQSSWDVDISRIDPEILEIKKYPYCPKCENIELNERKGRFGKIKWECIGCGFKTNNKLPAEQESRNALKIAKNEYIKSMNR